MEAKRNCGSDSADDETPTVPTILKRPVLASTIKVPETYFKQQLSTYSQQHIRQYTLDFGF
jgi:hypothetical protein